MQKEAWAQNAVITRDDGFSIRYRPRCPKCGFIPTYRDCGGSAREGVRAHDLGMCDKCGATFQIVISRG